MVRKYNIFRKPSSESIFKSLDRGLNMLIDRYDIVDNGIVINRKEVVAYSFNLINESSYL